MAGSENNQAKKSFWTDSIHDRERRFLVQNGLDGVRALREPWEALSSTLNFGQSPGYGEIPRYMLGVTAIRAFCPGGLLFSEPAMRGARSPSFA